MLFQCAEADWLKIAAEFQENWLFCNCTETFYGKSPTLFYLLSDGLNCYDYNGFQRIVLMGLTDT